MAARIFESNIVLIEMVSGIFETNSVDIELAIFTLINYISSTLLFFFVLNFEKL